MRASSFIKVASHSFLNLTLLVFCYPFLQYTLDLKGLTAFIREVKGVLQHLLLGQKRLLFITINAELMSFTIGS